MEPEQKQEITSDNRVIEEEKKLRIGKLDFRNNMQKV